MHPKDKRILDLADITPVDANVVAEGVDLCEASEPPHADPANEARCCTRVLIHGIIAAKHGDQLLNPEVAQTLAHDREVRVRLSMLANDADREKCKRAVFLDIAGTSLMCVFQMEDILAHRGGFDPENSAQTYEHLDAFGEMLLIRHGLMQEKPPLFPGNFEDEPFSPDNDPDGWRETYYTKLLQLRRNIVPHVFRAERDVDHMMSVDLKINEITMDIFRRKLLRGLEQPHIVRLLQIGVEYMTAAEEALERAESQEEYAVILASVSIASTVSELLYDALEEWDDERLMMDESGDGE